MAAAEYLIKHPEIKHGTIRILFTPDEEIGRGVDKVDMKKLGAEFGYTMDGESLGHIEAENFSADAVSITITGVSAHPGFAKGKMENAIKIAGPLLISCLRINSRRRLLKIWKALCILHRLAVAWNRPT